MKTEKEWTLLELAAKSGVPARTIRFYISRGLVEPPLRAGRGAAYGLRHLERLREIRRFQADGMPLAQIAHAPSGPPRAPALPSPSAWLSFPLSDDVMVWVRTNTAPWRAKHIRSALADFAARLAQAESIKTKEEHHEKS